MWSLVYRVILIVLTGYLLGNLNGAVSMSTLLAKDDVRSHGSGNAGLTNFIRNFGGWGAIPVLLIDVVKAVLACLVGGLLLEPCDLRMEGMMIGAVAVSLGHDFPALLGFKGGKGIVCGVSIAAVIDWRIALVLIAVFFSCYFLTHYVSLGSILGAAAFGILFAVLYRDRIVVAVGGALVGALAIWMHRANIARLCSGTERKSSLFGKGKS